MKYVIGLIALSIWLTSNVAQAGTIVTTFTGSPVTVTTNANQDTKLNKLLTKENNRRANQTPPANPITLEQFVSQIITAAIAGYSPQSDAAEQGDFCTAFATLTTNQKNQIITLGGGNSPCP